MSKPWKKQAKRPNISQPLNFRQTESANDILNPHHNSGRPQFPQSSQSIPPAPCPGTSIVQNIGTLVSLSVCRSVGGSVCASVCLWVCWWVCLCICLSLCLSLPHHHSNFLYIAYICIISCLSLCPCVLPSIS